MFVQCTGPVALSTHLAALVRFRIPSIAAGGDLLPIVRLLQLLSPGSGELYALLTSSNSALRRFRLLRPLLTSLAISLGLSTAVALRHRQGSPQVSHVRFASCLLDLRRLFPYRYGVNRIRPALPESPPHIQFLFVRLTFCYRLPSSVCYLPDSAESLVLPSIGRTVDFHHWSHVRCWAHQKKSGPPEKPGKPDQAQAPKTPLSPGPPKPAAGGRERQRRPF